MEKSIERSEASAAAAKMGTTRLSTITKSLKLGVRSVLTSCPYQEFCKKFPNFSVAEQERLYRIYTQVITWLPENIEKEFETLFLDTKAGDVFDTVEQLLEEQSLDPLHNTTSNIKEVGQSLTKAKRDEIAYLTKKVEMAEQQKHDLSAHLELLKSKSQEFSGAESIINKLRTAIVDYGAEHTLHAPYP